MIETTIIVSISVVSWFLLLEKVTVDFVVNLISSFRFVPFKKQYFFLLTRKNIVYVY